MGAMGERSYFQYPPPPPPPALHASPLRSSPSFPSDRDRYMALLLAERQKLGPFTQILPNSTRLLNQEIRRTSTFNHHHQTLELEQHSHARPMDMDPWPAMQIQENGHASRMGNGIQYSPIAWPGVPTTTVKRIIRLDVPVDKYPSYNFVGRILGPRGNSLKRVEAMTECRVYIRGRGSVKDAVKEEKLKDKSGFEHLNEPLHVLVEAEFPKDIINERVDHAVAILESLLKPVDESLDHYKKNQLRELAMLNGTLREESPSMSPNMSPSMSPFNSTGMKRAKTGR